MGVINITPDSFYSGSRQQGLDEILRKAEQMLNEGAAILDIGGQSTKPGSEILTVEDELQRVIKPIQGIRKYFPASFISIDTFYATVARQAAEAGADLVNDISAGEMDMDMFGTVAALKIPYVLMHKKGMPKTMQLQPDYKDVVNEVFDYLAEKRKQCLEAGIGQIIIDPGFGFGKNASHNFKLLGHLSKFKELGSPILAGLSRKTTIYKTLDTNPENALNGTTVLNTIALMNGADILRVHDVKEAVEAVKLYSAYRGNSISS
jgi:dihydropteroate synthase